MAYYSDRKVGDHRFPGPDTSNEAPAPTAQNPGQFFPASDDTLPTQVPGRAVERERGFQDADHLIGNPFLMHKVLNKLDHSLSEVIEIMENEGYRRPADESPELKEGVELFGKFEAWRGELTSIREGHGLGTEKSLTVEVEDSDRRRSSSRPLVSQEGPMFTD